MPLPPKKPSDPEISFGDFEDDAPTGKFAAAMSTGQRARRQGSAQPETLPAPPKAATPTSVPHGPVRPGYRPASSPNMAAQSVSRPAAVESGNNKPRIASQPGNDPDEPLFGAAPKQSGSTPIVSGGAQPGPIRSRVVTEKQIAPLPPRMPTLGPEPEFSFGIEVLAQAPASDPPDGHEMSSHSRASQPKSTGGVENLTWDLRSEPPDDDMRPTPLPLSMKHNSGDAHSLVERASNPAMAIPTDPRRELKERFALGDYSGALVIAESLIADGARDSLVGEIADGCRDRLQQMYTSRLGNLRQAPSMAVPRSELKWLSLDHRAGFVLSLVDGTSSMEEIIDVSGMPALEVLRTLYDLMIQRVIEFKNGPSVAKR